MMTSIRDAALQAPLYSYLIAGPAAALALVGAVAAITALLKRGRPPLQQQAPQRPTPMPHARYLTINVVQLCAFGAAKLYVIPRLPLVRWGAPTVLDTAAAIVAALLLTDLGYWAYHRLMHTDFFWRRVHFIHHEVTAPRLVSDTYYEHPAEFFVGSIITLLPLAILPIHIAGLLIAVFLQALLGIAHHSGRDIRGPFAASGHDLHHERGHGNYAQNFALVDRLFGTAL